MLTAENEESCIVMKDMKLSRDETFVDFSTTFPSSKPRSKGTAVGLKKKPTTLPNETVEYLKAWMMSPEHIAHPYPTESEKAQIMADTGLELKQLTNWFVNNRKRYWKPRVEARLKDKDPSEVTTLEVVSPTMKHEVSTLTSSEAQRPLSDPSTNLVLLTRSSKRRVPKNKLPVIVSPLSSVGPHLVSGHNSVASSDGTTSCSDSDDERYSAASTPIR
jgi:hypothetical protein